ncbi:hypothetical protein PHYBLDRAFT_176306 [Phycomyces blakesleeanus NRRL 1555(-)]|uniref:Uncharacterized protein n=1 Tax=Phycomyces blakesleeanus (strain ATCC 8743b / DSM 1359 / FGSC 10004 / NBRC 33097 / NRRL 1555) TaxID=763407 RepID=A0A162PFQ3_PHYB8|nr:hypothetical protein PHYBLDRAFT_176306 [Phycomyces blakesleeanus NRRL 1555(-)]OAD65266.1 hypothetical protein PHYBLDRAFT_176306 [Phycomyces blakesleeanus NRRL 1555(-)]|eukprot:XP_018283306.1 hypothetical protein PHYBLDRAFT_176306 [Phycomyces blakesleeanus NRRL 1555(-)]
MIHLSFRNAFFDVKQDSRRIDGTSPCSECKIHDYILVKFVSSESMQRFVLLMWCCGLGTVMWIILPEFLSVILISVKIFFTLWITVLSDAKTNVPAISVGICGRVTFATIRYIHYHFGSIKIAVIYAPATVSRPRAFFTSILQLTQFGQPAPSSRFLVLKHFYYTYTSTSSHPCHTSLPWLHHVQETSIDCVTDEAHTERGLWRADSRLKIPSYFQERFSVSLQGILPSLTQLPYP